jgi:hypothetical protein
MKHLCFGPFYPAVFVAMLISVSIRSGFAIGQTANSNAGLEGGQDGLFGAIGPQPGYRQGFQLRRRLQQGPRLVE